MQKKNKKTIVTHNGKQNKDFCSKVLEHFHQVYLRKKNVGIKTTRMIILVQVIFIQMTIPLLF